MNLRKTSSCCWHKTSTVGIPSAHELCLEIVEFATGHGGTDAVDQTYRPPLVVDRRQGVGEQLPGLEEVVQVGAGDMGAGVAVTSRFQWPEIVTERRGVDVVASVGGVDGGIARHPGGVDAVEGVGTGPTRGEEIVWFGDAEQVTGTVLRQLVGAPADDRAKIGLLDGPTDTKPVEALPVDRHRREIAAGPATQVLVLGSLNDAVEGLVGTLGTLGAQTSMLGQAPPTAGCVPRPPPGRRGC